MSLFALPVLLQSCLNVVFLGYHSSERNSCWCGRKRSSHTSFTVQIIFQFWSFVTSKNIILDFGSDCISS